MPKMVNPLFFPYSLACTHAGCQGKQLIEQAQSAGWVLGMIIPEDSSNPEVGRCPKCRRCKMKVVNAPEPPKPKGPIGWTKVPEK